mgnify:CR=1 FL=1
MPWITASIKDVKWYDSFEDVKAHEDMLELCVECGGSYKFVRIGEEYDDLDEREGGEGDADATNHGYPSFRGSETRAGGPQTES